MNQTLPGLIIFVIATGLLHACSSLPNISDTRASESLRSTETEACPVLPGSFEEGDLIGTWVARYGLDDTDTLVINGDGTYKQIYANPDANIEFESEWLDWRIEYRESGLARIHLDGMRLCNDIESICFRMNGGIDPDLFTAIDVCEGGSVEMADKVVLIVSGANFDAPRGIVLHHTRIAGSRWSWSFELAEE